MRYRRIGLFVAILLTLGVVWSLVQIWTTEPLLSSYVIAPGADPAVLPLDIEAVNFIEVDRSGALLVHYGSRVRRQPLVRAYQQIDGRRHDVSVRFEITPTGDPKLHVGPYDRSQPLVIEP